MKKNLVFQKCPFLKITKYSWLGNSQAHSYCKHWNRQILGPMHILIEDNAMVLCLNKTNLLFKNVQATCWSHVLKPRLSMEYTGYPIERYLGWSEMSYSMIFNITVLALLISSSKSTSILKRYKTKSYLGRTSVNFYLFSKRNSALNSLRFTVFIVLWFLKL